MWQSRIRTLCLVSLVACVAAAPAVGDDVLISSGKSGGYYDMVAGRLRALLTGALEAPVDHHSSGGSLENLAGLADPESKVSIGFTQRDALEAWLARHPDFATQYTIIGSLGKECAFLIAAVQGGPASVADLLAVADGAVAVGDPGSGAAVTWTRLGVIDPRLAKTPGRNVDVVEALLQLGRRERDEQVAAALVIQRPLAMGSAVEMVLANPDRYRFVPIRSQDLVAPVAQELSYSFETVSIGFGSNYTAEVETVCTEGLALAHKGKLGEKRLAQIERALLDSGRLVFTPSR